LIKQLKPLIHFVFLNKENEKITVSSTNEVLFSEIFQSKFNEFFENPITKKIFCGLLLVLLNHFREKIFGKVFFLFFDSFKEQNFEEIFSI